MKFFLSALFLCFSAYLFGQTHFYIANRDGNNVLRYTMDGDFVEEFVTANSGNLSSPQEVFFHPVDGSLIVTGFNNSTIKRYDGETGEFLGDFSQGYNLSNPTKMIMGSDSLIYVTQWGTVQNKIVRFDLNGNFVDEWSSVNVPEGCGMAFDSNGNLYVTTWSNGQNNGAAGFVRKFDSEGNDLGIIVNSAILQGPVGIWIDENEDLFVVDWTLGRVIRFNSDGEFISNFISGMTRTEGNAMGPDGKYYLCDWQDNKINRYNEDGSFDATLVSTGLDVPNSITFGPDGLMSGQEELLDARQTNVYPNPAVDEIRISFSASGKMPSDVYIFNSTGQLELTVSTGSQLSDEMIVDISSLESGVFFYSFTKDGKQLSRSFVKM